MNSEHSNTALVERLEAIEQQLRFLGAPAQPEPVPSSTSAPRRFTICAHFSRNTQERKPFSVTFDGQKVTFCTLTPIRAAILLVLLMDLLERGEHNSSSTEPLSRVQQALRAIAPEHGEETTYDAVRVAFYRAGNFIRKVFSESLAEDLSFRVNKGRLVVVHHGEVVPAEDIEIRLTTSDRGISSYIDHSLAASPLARLRRCKALYVPAGKEGQDRLSLELLDHDHPVSRTCLFYRPSIESFPPDLLAKLHLNNNRRKRQAAALSGYKNGRFQYTEIMPRTALWNMIRRSSDGTFSLYPPEATASDVARHLEHLQSLVKNVPSYELVITDAFFPFYLSTYEINRPGKIERFLLFFQQAEHDSVREVSAFALHDDGVVFNTHDRIIHWVLDHPSTTRNRQTVLEELQAVHTALIEEKPLPA